MTRKEQSKMDEAEADQKRLIAFSETPGFTPVSDGSGREKNVQLRKLNELNQHSSHPTERRKAGFPSTFGQLARRAQEQTETGNESRARLLPVKTSRLAREAAEMPEPVARRPVDLLVPYWLWVPILVCASWVAVELYLMVSTP
jgi:hypothetical protein